MCKAQKVVIGVVGGSGFYSIDGVKVKAEHDIDTPYGKPSTPIVEMDIDGRSAYFIARHGKGHTISPSEINFRANIYAFKSLGVNTVLSVNAVGIMREDIKPGDLIVPDQVFDRTKGVRKSTYFEDGIVGHVSMADPFCKHMAEVIIKAAQEEKGPKVHTSGTIIVIEGPQFSTRAESHFYRKTLRDPVAIGMTTLPEAKLAREAEMCYAVLANATDYDCWHEDEDDVSADAVLDVAQQTSKTTNSVIKRIIKTLPDTMACKCFSSVKNVIYTDSKLLDPALRERLTLLYGKYFE